MIRKANRPSRLGDRMREFRESIRPEVKLRALDRCYGAGNRWSYMEGFDDAPGSRRDMVRESLAAVMDRMDATDAQREAAVSYVLDGIGALPWDVAPSWKPGASPAEKPGRKPEPIKATDAAVLCAFRDLRRSVIDLVMSPSAESADKALETLAKLSHLMKNPDHLAGHSSAA